METTTVNMSEGEPTGIANVLPVVTAPPTFEMDVLTRIMLDGLPTVNPKNPGNSPDRASESGAIDSFEQAVLAKALLQELPEAPAPSDFDRSVDHSLDHAKSSTPKWMAYSAGAVIVVALLLWYGYQLWQANTQSENSPSTKTQNEQNSSTVGGNSKSRSTNQSPIEIEANQNKSKREVGSSNPTNRPNGLKSKFKEKPKSSNHTKPSSAGKPVTPGDPNANDE